MKTTQITALITSPPTNAHDFVLSESLLTAVIRIMTIVSHFFARAFETHKSLFTFLSVFWVEGEGVCITPLFKVYFGRVVTYACF